ncbi:MAG: diguanylate cyclase (GGDEF)-like protein/PAS domain S-box-containing protein [Gammaproteobacteria bacterium]
MTEDNDKTSADSIDLRHKAEAEASLRHKVKSSDIALLSANEVKQMLHELEVHQIELEMQNQDLRETQIMLDASRERYFDLYNMSPVGYCTLNEAGIILEANLTLSSLLDIHRSKLLKQSFSRFIFKDDQDDYYLKTKHVLLSEENLSFELRMLTSSNRIVWVHLSSMCTKDTDGYAELRVAVNDITEQRMLQQQERIAAIAFESLEGMIITDANDLILRVNRALIGMSGYSAEKIIGQSPDIFNSGRHPPSFFIAMRATLKSKEKWSGEIWERRKNGEVYPAWMTINAVRNNQGDISNYVYTINDITLTKMAEEKIKALAFYDPLTKLPNRRLMLDRLEHALSSRARHKRLGAVLMIDLDNFKILNDSLGHDMGDKLLVIVASRLESCLREGDTVARIGGDEFLVIIEDLDEKISVDRQAEAVAKKFIAYLKEPYILQQGFKTDLNSQVQYHCSCSIGIALFSEQAISVEELIKQADTAMYAAKAGGRNTLRFFAPSMHTSMVIRAALEDDIRNSLDKGQFVLYYQPLVSFKNRLIGVEALIRWLHPERGIIQPDEFIPAAEASGLIVPLGLMVLQNACDQLAKWACIPKMAELSIAVNVSAIQFHQPQFVNQVLAELKRSGANPLRLNLELTESVMVYDLKDVFEKMVTLKASGIAFSLDDFGTGYSCLSYLKQLPLDRLKIDKSFVLDILEDKDDAAIAQMIIALSQSMGMEVSAEGVENKAQLDCLEGMGCHMYQGYLFSRPLPVKEFEMFARHVSESHH